MTTKTEVRLGRKLSAGVVLVRPVAGGFNYLLLRVYRYWDFPKGEVAPGESPQAAARREVAEETGIQDLELPWGNDYYETPPYARGKVARYYLGMTRQETVTLGVNPQLGYPEHHAYRWLAYDAARALLNDRVRAVLDWAHHRITEDGARING